MKNPGSKIHPNLLIAVLLLFICGGLVAQSDFTTPRLSAVAHGGFIIPHRTVMKGLVKGHTKSLEMAIEWQASGSHPWHHYFDQPSVGIELFMHDPGNRDELGYHHSLNLFVRAPLSRGARNLQFLKFGLGPGYSTKLWHLHENVRNTAVSARISVSLLLQYGWQFQLTDELNLLTGLRLSHYSNGGLKQPNLGINSASVYLGLLFGQTPPPLRAAESESFEREFQPSLTFSFGRSDIDPEPEHLYSAWTLTGLVDLRASAKSKFGFGIDMMYNEAIVPRLMQEGLDFAGNSANIQLGALFSYSLVFGDFDLKVMAGLYVKNERPDLGLMYNRFGLRYHYRKLHFNMMLKSHLTKAEYPELGIGYTF